MKHGQPISPESKSVTQEQEAALRELLPQAFTEGRVDLDKLRTALGSIVDDSPERYSFTWAGKRDAIRLLQTPTRATLVAAPDESVDFDQTQNVFIEGDNLEVLKLLYKPYSGRVKMIYIDPPYNTGNDYIYPDDYTDPLASYLQLTGQRDAGGNDLTNKVDRGGRYHSSWLSMMYPRLFLSRQLLRDDGVIFVSIDDNEVYNLRMIMNELFGEENFVAEIAWEKKYSVSNNAQGVASTKDYIVVYARTSRFNNGLFPRTSESLSRYQNPDNDPRGPWKPVDYWNIVTVEKRPNLVYPITNPNTLQEIKPTKRAWKFSKEVYEQHVREKRLWWGIDGKNSVPALKLFLSDVRDGMIPSNWWPHREAGHTDEASKELQELFDGQPVFDTPKPVRLIKRILQVAGLADKDIVLDFFAGSSTTAHALLTTNRERGGNQRFILIQLPEPTGRADYPTIADIGKERIRRVIEKMRDQRPEQKPPDGSSGEDLGFKVFKLAPSHFKQWVGVKNLTPEQYTNQMSLYDDPLVDGWTAEGVIQEVALKEGYGLNCGVEELTDMKGAKAYRVTDPDREQTFTICLDDRITLAALTRLHLSKNDLFVCRDSALDDEAAANLALQCRLKTI